MNMCVSRKAYLKALLGDTAPNSTEILCIKVEKLRNPEARRVCQSGLATRCRDVNCVIQGGSVEEVWRQ